MLNVFKIIIHIAALYGLYTVGTWIQQIFNLFIPGSVIGLILLFILLMTGTIKTAWVEKGAQFMIKHLALFFIPATVGAMNYFDLFAGKGLLLVIIGLSSTLMVMVSAGHVSQMFMHKRERSHE
ncbi:CidA/LrgA family protein [Virgibacillus ainsalahensis]